MLAIIQTLLSVIPSLLLCFAVYKLDKTDKEPPKLLALLFFAGFIGFFPLFHLQNLIVSVIDKAFTNQITTNAPSPVQLQDASFQFLHHILLCIFAYALPEVLMQWVLLVVLTKNKKDFNCLFDGLLYSIILSFGFAISKNLCVTWTQGWKEFFIRALAAIPMYLMISIVCGVFYTLWHTYDRVYETEAVLIEQSTIQKHSIRRPLSLFALSFFIPFIIHGFMSYTLLTQSGFAKIAFYCLVALLYITFFIVIIKFSRRDSETDRFAVSMIIKAHPTIQNEQIRLTYQSLYKEYSQSQNK